MKLKQKNDVGEQDMMKAQKKILELLKSKAELQESSQKLLQEETDNCRREREDRVAQFLHYMDVKRNAYIKEAKLSDLSLLRIN